MASSRFVRSSKFRHVFGTGSKKENQYDNLAPSRSAWDSNKVACSTKFVACIWEARGGGSFTVIPKENTGKLPAGYPLVVGHSADVLDLEFNPFNPDLVVSTSEDCYAKVWKIPEGGLTAPMSEPVQNLMGHKRKVGSVHHNPVANNVLATTSVDYTIKIWDVEKGSANLDVTGHSDIIQSASWNWNGTLLSTTSKDKKLRLIDVRSGKITSEVEAHGGIKGTRSLWLGEKELIITTGFSKTSDRQYSIWDPKNMDTPISKANVDTSSGIIMPFYDNDTKMLYLAGKGDGNIRYYEIVDETPFIHPLSEYKSSVPQRGMCLGPKLMCDITSCEVAHILKLTGNSIEPIQFCVPRKSDIFQDDIYPDTYAGEPAMSSQEWFGGSISGPKLLKVEPGDAFNNRTTTATFNPEQVAAPKELTEKEAKAEVERLTKRVAYLEAELVKRDATIASLQS